MRTTRTRLISTVLALTALAAAVALLGGCKSKVPVTVTSAWPTAEKERTVSEPQDAARWPFTGLEALDASAVSRRPLSVKIENSPAARPQFNLSSADIVYESVTEGGITRFNAIFHSTLPNTVGPVRSARLSDIWIVPQYDALFAFSGASSSVNGAVRRAQLPNLSQDIGVSKPYSRNPQRRSPHNLMLDPAKAYEEAETRKMRTTSTLTPMQYGRARDTSETATSATIVFSTANTSVWQYDETSGEYLRSNNGAAHMDAATGEQLSADNVVVLWAKHSMTRGRDSTGATTYDITLGGEGRVTILRDGKRYNGTWIADETTAPRFKDGSGQPIKLKPGRTWVQVIDLSGSLMMR